MLSPGARFDRYVVERVLGRGGMGIVYCAVDPKLGRRVALKVVMLAAGGSSADSSARLLREARAAAALDHPNAVAIFDVGEVAGEPYLAMELVPGKSMRELVGDATIPLATRVAWLGDVARALGAAHRAGLVHRDVKPENVMVRDDGLVKVLDFGIARRSSAAIDPTAATAAHLATITGEGVAVGTPLYMAPEQLRGEKLDGRTDQFAWGVLAYELLAGASPWAGAGDVLSLAAAITSRTPADLGGLVPELPPGVAAAVMRALEKNAGKRFDTMDAVVASLDGTRRFASETIPHRATRARLALGVGAGVLTLGALSLLLSARAEKPAASAAPGASAPADTSPLVVPLPTVGKPEAIAAYADALVAFRDGKDLRYLHSLERATELDPSFAPAQVRLAVTALINEWVPALPARQALAQASSSRHTLEPRDRVLYDAAQALLNSDPLDAEAFLTVLRPAAERAPRDADLQILFGKALHASGRLDDALRVAAAVERLDPGFALVHLLRADVAWSRGDTSARGRAFDECVARFPQATVCLTSRNWLSDRSCTEMESDARRALAIDPENRDAAFLLLNAALATGRPEATVTAARDQFFARRSRGSRESSDSVAAWMAASVAMSAGKLDEAMSVADDFLTRHPTDVELRFSFHTVVRDMALETGDRRQAASRARRMLDESSLWARASETEMGELLSAAFRTGVIDRAELDRGVGEFRARLPGLYEKLPYFREGTDRVRYGLWIDGYARTAVSPDDAKLAVQRFDDEKLVTLPVVDAQLAVHGRVLLDAHRIDEAIALLRRASTTCHATENTQKWIQASLDLGHAYEEKGDTAAACEAYGKVLTHWGSAKRSVSAEDARARRKKLGCRS